MPHFMDCTLRANQSGDNLVLRSISRKALPESAPDPAAASVRLGTGPPDAQPRSDGIFRGADDRLLPSAHSTRRERRLAPVSVKSECRFSSNSPTPVRGIRHYRRRIFNNLGQTGSDSRMRRSTLAGVRAVLTQKCGNPCVSHTYPGQNGIGKLPFPANAWGENV